MIAPTEISVPALDATQSVIPTAKMINSLDRLKISTRYPYNTPFLIEISKNDGDFIRLNNNTSARHTIGQKRRYDVIFFNLSIIICHLLRLLSLHFPVIIHFLPILRLSHHLVKFPCESRYEAFLLLRMK